MQKFIYKSDERESRVNEAINTLKTNIEFSGEDIKVVALTSSLPNEGKSTVSFMLAEAFAREGIKTLYIDADLRLSVLTQKYEVVDVKYGLTEYLSGKQKLDEVVCSTSQDNLFVICSGTVPPNPSALFNGKHFEELIVAARDKYDMIVIDTPPVGSVIDAAIISKHCDGVAVVVCAKKTSRKFVKKTIQQLDTAGANIIGVVLNQVEISKHGYYGKYYGKYYDGYYAK